MTNLIAKRNSVKVKRVLAVMILIVSVLLLATSCKVSENVQGTWFAQDGDNEDHIIKFDEKMMIIDGVEYEVKQTSVTINNNVRYYGFNHNGKIYVVFFPNGDDISRAILLYPYDMDDKLKGKVLYVMNRNEKPDYEEYVNLYLER